MVTPDVRHLSVQDQEALRRRVVQSVADGMSKSEAARVYGVSRRSVVSWCKLLEAGGTSSLQTQARGRKKGIVLDQSRAGEIVKTMTITTPYKLKLKKYYLWTWEAVRPLIEGRYKIRISIWTVKRYLQKWGFDLKGSFKPSYKLMTLEERTKYQKIYTTAQREAKQNRAMLFRVTETQVNLDPHKDVPPRNGSSVDPENVSQSGFNLISAINVRNKVFFMVYKGEKTNLVFARFLWLLQKHVRSRIYLIVEDNPVHRSPEVQGWVAQFRGRIRLFILSEDNMIAETNEQSKPEINPIPKWKKVRFNTKDRLLRKIEYKLNGLNGLEEKLLKWERKRNKIYLIRSHQIGSIPRGPHLMQKLDWGSLKTYLESFPLVDENGFAPGFVITTPVKELIIQQDELMKALNPKIKISSILKRWKEAGVDIPYLQDLFLRLLTRWSVAILYYYHVKMRALESKGKPKGEDQVDVQSGNCTNVNHGDGGSLTVQNGFFSQPVGRRSDAWFYDLVKDISDHIQMRTGRRYWKESLYIFRRCFPSLVITRELLSFSSHFTKKRKAPLDSWIEREENKYKKNVEYKEFKKGERRGTTTFEITPEKTEHENIKLENQNTRKKMPVPDTYKIKHRIINKTEDGDVIE